jgi:phosphoglycolate phosphatase
LAYRLVIFDFDGTLADSGDWFISMTNGVADRFKFRRITDEEVDMLRGRSSREVVEYMGVAKWKMPLIAIHARKLVAQHASNIPLFPGVPALLHGLRRAGVTVALVSSNSEANIRKILGPELSALVTYFNCGASVFGKTPKFRAVVRRAKVPKSEVISIGDETRDIEAAAKAGIASGAVTWGYARPEILAEHKPTILFNAMSEILPAVAG